MARSITASELGIDLKPDDDSGLFKWFIASFLMSKRIQAPIAARKLQHCTSSELVAMFGRAHYVRALCLLDLYPQHFQA